VKGKAMENKKPKDKLIACFIGFFFGCFGLHNFYLRAVGAGIIGFCTLSFGGILSLYEVIVLMRMRSEEFDNKYNKRTPYPFEFAFITQEEYENPGKSRKILASLIVIAFLCTLIILNGIAITSFRHRLENPSSQISAREIEDKWENLLLADDEKGVMDLIEYELQNERQADARRHLFHAKDMGMSLYPHTPEAKKLLWEWFKTERNTR
jgi:TM2 domain-containing membrane protein YozV